MQNKTIQLTKKLGSFKGLGIDHVNEITAVAWRLVIRGSLVVCMVLVWFEGRWGRLVKLNVTLRKR